VQGHNETPNPSNGHGWLVGHMTVEWKQPVKEGEDPTASCHTQNQVVRVPESGSNLDAANYGRERKRRSSLKPRFTATGEKSPLHSQPGLE